MKLTALEEEFASVARISGGVYLLAANDALRFIEECERRDIDILGIDGFRVFGPKTQPLQEHSFDLEGKLTDNHRISKDFVVARLNNDLWFEIVTADRAD
jgi:hypothetical protein